MRLQTQGWQMRSWLTVAGAAVLSLAAACGVKTNPDNPNTSPTPPGLLITDIVPAVGPVVGGQEVQINGQDFDDGTQQISVLFGAEVATVTNLTNTTLTVVTPAQSAEGAVNVQVTNAFGSYTFEAGYTYEQTELLYGALSIFSFYDILNPGQFGGNPADFADAFASFVEPTTESLLLPLAAADSCELNPTSPPGNFTPLDTGSSVQFASGGATVTLTKCTDHTQITPCAAEDLSYYPELVIETPGVFLAQTMYDESSAGGSGLASFNATAAIATPSDFSVTGPSIDQGTDTSNYYNLSRSAGDTFTWSGGTAGDAFFIILSGYDTNTQAYTGQEIVCRPADDGSFTVAGNFTSQLTQGDTAVVYIARRTEADWLLAPNNSAGQSVGIIYKIGVVNLVN